MYEKIKTTKIIHHNIKQPCSIRESLCFVKNVSTFLFVPIIVVISHQTKQ